MKIIYTSKGEKIFVDDEDYEWLNQYNWCLSRGYASRARWLSDGDASKIIMMHRQIMGAKKGELVDHIDRNRKNNQRSNLRICSYAENARNHKVLKCNKSGVTGVRWDEPNQKWIVIITVNKESLYLGLYSSFEEAVEVRKEAEVKYFGEFRAIDLYIDEDVINNSMLKAPVERLPIDRKNRQNNTSGIMGICWDKKSQKWKTYIRVDKKVVYLGLYSDLEEAKKIRTEAELKYYGRTRGDKNIEQC